MNKSDAQEMIRIVMKDNGLDPDTMTKSEHDNFIANWVADLKGRQHELKQGRYPGLGPLGKHVLPGVEPDYLFRDQADGKST